MKRRAVSCLVALLLLALIPAAQARGRRHRKPNPIVVALQTFLLVRSVVHIVAEPVVRHTSKAAVTLATAPIRVAYRRARERNDEVVQGEPVAENAPTVARAIPLREPATYDQPFRVAYLAPRPKKRRPPRAQQVAEVYEDFPEGLDESDAKDHQGPTVVGSRALLRNGIAYAPKRAPQSVKNAIWAANSLRRKPYVWGGGHGSFSDDGYDCSGTVSFVLRGAGAVAAPLASDELMRYGKRGRGRWFTIYARRGHTFAVIAGLRLDTTNFQNGGNTGPRWHLDMRDTRGYVARHPAGM